MRAMKTLTDIALATIEAHDLIPRGSVVVAMVSGGADSIAMLRVLAREAIEREWSLSVLHINHLLRGAESDGDERFVVDACERMGVPCTVVRYDVAELAHDEGLNLEDAGRRVRYRFAHDELGARCDAVGLPRTRGRIATAHTLDDRVETFLMRVLEGTGAGGLASIRHARGEIVRPLLECAREDVRSALRAEGIEWREDASNSDTTRKRAWLRHDVVPLLEGANPRLREALMRTMDITAAEDDLLGDMARAFVRDFAEAREGEVVFERAMMCTLSRAMARRTVREALAVAFPDDGRIELEHVDAVVDGMACDDFVRDLSGGLRAFTEYGRLVVARPGDAPALAPTLLEVPSTLDMGAAGRLSASGVQAGDVSGAPLSVVIDRAALRGQLVVDRVRPGDRIQPLGMEGSRKVSDVLVDAKVPARHRGLVPVVRDGEDVVWVGGVRLSEKYRLGPGTASVIRLTWEPGEWWLRTGVDDDKTTGPCEDLQ